MYVIDIVPCTTTEQVYEGTAPCTRCTARQQKCTQRKPQKALYTAAVNTGRPHTTRCWPTSSVISPHRQYRLSPSLHVTPPHVQKMPTTGKYIIHIHIIYSSSLHIPSLSCLHLHIYIEGCHACTQDRQHSIAYPGCIPSSSFIIRPAGVAEQAVRRCALAMSRCQCQLTTIEKDVRPHKNI